MSYGLEFSQALKDNIKRTYTYSFAVNTLGHQGDADGYDPLWLFEKELKNDPFVAFMRLERYGYKNTLNAIQRYKIPYTPEQERRARVKYEVTETMLANRSDAVYMYIEDLTGTGVVDLGDYQLTTYDTLRVTQFIHHLNVNQTTNNVYYPHHVRGKLTGEQEKAVKNALKYQFSCLIGGAGTGKSYVTSTIIDQLHANKKRVAILAPTHKAREALQDKLSTGVGEVRTIHSYVHGKTNRMFDAIVIDEAGMISTPLMDMLIKAYHAGQQLLFVGDKNQLEPVEYGRPFELLMNRLKIAELKENHRSESRDIISLGRELLGETVNKNIDITNIQIVDTIQEAFNRGAEVLLTFTNKDVQYVNDEQKLKRADRAISSDFSVGDKIIAKTNNAPHYYNGQLFELIAYDKARNVRTHTIITFKTWQDLKYNFDLAYGLTIHKSQGSEWGTVAYLPSEYDTRNLAYVAVTRAKHKLILVGDLPDTNQLKQAKEWKHLEVNSL